MGGTEETGRGQSETAQKPAAIRLPLFAAANALYSSAKDQRPRLARHFRRRPVVPGQCPRIVRDAARHLPAAGQQ
jgi:hypothetical protein